MALEVKPMEVKKQEREEKVAKETAVKQMKPTEWIESIKAEIKAIHWTSPEELRVYTQIVVIGTFVFGMGVYLVDLAIHSALEVLMWLSRLIVG